MKSKVYGTKYNKIRVETPEKIEELKSLIEGEARFLTSLDEKKKKIWVFLKELGFEVEPAQNIVLFRGKYVKNKEDFIKYKKDIKKTVEERKQAWIEEKMPDTNINDVNLPKLPSMAIEKFSKLDVLTKLILKIELVQNENNSIEHRINQAYLAGSLAKTVEVLYEFGLPQKKIAQQTRKKGLPEIFRRLKIRKNASLISPKELWPDFISMLTSDSENFDQVEERATNSHNVKVWYVSYEDAATGREAKMTYKTFTNRLQKGK